MRVSSSTAQLAQDPVGFPVCFFNDVSMISIDA
jgi:hypothetical protein